MKGMLKRSVVWVEIKNQIPVWFHPLFQIGVAWANRSHVTNK